jgi:hypothetical protein
MHAPFSLAPDGEVKCCDNCRNFTHYTESGYGRGGPKRGGCNRHITVLQGGYGPMVAPSVHCQVDFCDDWTWVKEEGH